jgi:hypothetical protein
MVSHDHDHAPHSHRAVRAVPSRDEPLGVPVPGTGMVGAPHSQSAAHAALHMRHHPDDSGVLGRQAAGAHSVTSVQRDLDSAGRLAGVGLPEPPTVGADLVPSVRRDRGGASRLAGVGVLERPKTGVHTVLAKDESLGVQMPGTSIVSAPRSQRAARAALHLRQHPDDIGVLERPTAGVHPVPSVRRDLGRASRLVWEGVLVPASVAITGNPLPTREVALPW